MSRFVLSPRERLAVLGGGALIAGILFLGRGVPAAARWNERMVTETALTMRRLRLVETLVRDRTALRDSVGVYRARLDSLEERSFVATTPAMAGVALAGALEHLAMQHRLSPSSTVVLADSVFAAPAVLVSVRLHASADTEGLLALLRAIESSALGLKVTELTVSQSEPAADVRQAESLRVELLVSARARAPQPVIPS